MGQLSSTLEEFEGISREYYEQIMGILEDKYCWKCPQHSTSGKIWCREIDAWIRLINIMESGINESLKVNYSEDEIESINLNLLQKLSKKTQKPRTFLLKSDKDQGQLIKKNDILLVSENMGKARQGDLVLISEICPIISYLQFKLDFNDFPYKIERINKIMIKDRVRYMETEDKTLMPVIQLMGRVIKVISPEKSLYNDFNQILSL